MTGVVLGNIFSASIFQKKKKNELGLVAIKNLKKLPFWDEENLT